MTTRNVAAAEAYNDALIADTAFDILRANVVTARNAFLSAFTSAASGTPALLTQLATTRTAGTALVARFGGTGPIEPPYSLLYSRASDRSTPLDLDGATVNGNIYVYLGYDNADITQVQFYLNNPAATGTPFKTETGAPYDFNGGTGGGATAYNTALLTNGANSITAKVTRVDTSVEIVTANFTVQNGTVGTYPANFVKPTLVSPTTITLSDSAPSFTGDATKDYIFQITGTTTKPLAIKNIRNGIFATHGGRITIGLAISPTATEDNVTAMKHRALYLDKIQGTLWIEGMHIDGSNLNMTEGIQLFNSPGKVIIVRSRINDVRLKPSMYTQSNPAWHGDLLQVGGAKNGIFLHRCTLYGSAYQGIYMEGTGSSQVLGPIRYNKVNFRGIRRQIIFVNSFTNNPTNPVWVEATDVYNEQSTGESFAQYNSAQSGAAYPLYPQPPTVTSGYVQYTSSFPRVATGIRVNRGAPPGGDYAPANKVGANYNAADSFWST